MSFFIKLMSVFLAIILAVAVILTVEFLLARQGPHPTFNNPSRQTQLFGTGATALKYVVMGDSTAAGQGADYSAGIAVATARHLAEQRAVSLVNLAVSGATMQEVWRDQLSRAVALKPDVVLISAGANDVTHLTGPATVAKYQAEIIDGLVASNCHIKIVVTASPQMGSIPRFLWPLSQIAAARTGQVNRAITKVVAAKHITLAPIAAETGATFKAHPELFSDDKYHPNAAGYAVWAPVLIQALDAPQPGHC